METHMSRNFSLVRLVHTSLNIRLASIRFERDKFRALVDASSSMSNSADPKVFKQIRRQELVRLRNETKQMKSTLRYLNLDRTDAEGVSENPGSIRRRSATVHNLVHFARQHPWRSMWPGRQRSRQWFTTLAGKSMECLTANAV